MESKIDKIKELLKKSIKRQIPDSLTYLPNAVKINREIYRQYAGGGREKIVLDILMQIYNEELSDAINSDIFVKNLITAGFNHNLITQYIIDGHLPLSDFTLKDLWKLYVISKNDEFLNKLLNTYKLAYDVLSLIIARDVSNTKRLANDPKILDIYRLSILGLNNVSFINVIGVMNKKNMFSKLPKPFYNVIKERINDLPFHRQVDIWQNLKNQHHDERLKTLHLFSKINDKDYYIIGSWDGDNIIIKSKTKPLYGIANDSGIVIIKPIFNMIGPFNSLNTAFAKSLRGNEEIEPGLYEIHRDGRITVIKK